MPSARITTSLKVFAKKNGDAYALEICSPRQRAALELSRGDASSIKADTFNDWGNARTTTGEEEWPFPSRGGAPLSAREKTHHESERYCKKRDPSPSKGRGPPAREDRHRPRIARLQGPRRKAVMAIG